MSRIPKELPRDFEELPAEEKVRTIVERLGYTEREARRIVAIGSGESDGDVLPAEAVKVGGETRGKRAGWRV